MRKVCIIHHLPYGDGYPCLGCVAGLPNPISDMTIIQKWIWEIDFRNKTKES